MASGFQLLGYHEFDHFSGGLWVVIAIVLGDVAEGAETLKFCISAIGKLVVRHSGHSDAGVVVLLHVVLFQLVDDLVLLLVLRGRR